MAVHHDTQMSILESLYCDEEKWGEIEQDYADDDENDVILVKNSPFPSFQLDLVWDDEELKSLFVREKETCIKDDGIVVASHFSGSIGRKEAVEWILKIHAHFGFSALTAVLAVNYLDRFVSNLSLENDVQQQPWMMKLAAVTCFSLAAKVEESHVPLLLDLQVERTDCVFKAKTIQRMEILVLQSLKWRMNPVTPISFFDHVIRRLGLNSYIHWEFLQNCENLLLSVVSDSRFVHYLPSVLATTIMLHVIHQVEPFNAFDHENQLLGVLKISKDEVDDCYEVISDILSSNDSFYLTINPLKRKICRLPISPTGVADAFFSSDSSNESWGVESCISSSSPHQQIYKKSRVQEQKMKLPSLSSRVYVEAIGSPH